MMRSRRLVACSGSISAHELIGPRACFAAADRSSDDENARGPSPVQRFIQVPQVLASIDEGLRRGAASVGLVAMALCLALCLALCVTGTTRVTHW